MKNFLLILFLPVACSALIGLAGTASAAQSPAGDTTVYGVPNPLLMYALVPQFPDSMPQFGNGMDDQEAYVNQHVHYPEAEKRAGISGTVEISFVVETDGTLSRIHPIVQVPNGPGLTEESIRLVKTMPKWKPALKDGIPVRCWANVGVTFKLN